MHFANSSFGFQFIDSDEDNDGYVDTDEEVSNGRLSLLNGSGPPYFHGYLYMKSEGLLYFACVNVGRLTEQNRHQLSLLSFSKVAS